MWIRSQDKTRLVDVNSIEIVENKVMCKNWTLGKYETRGRTLEVLDEIQNHLNYFRQGYSEVFEMPEK